MNRSSFKQMLKRYVAGTASEEEKALIDHWYELLYNDSFRTLNDAELVVIEQEMWSKIEQDADFTKETGAIHKIPVRKMVIRWTAAAAILAGAAFGLHSLIHEQHASLAYEQIKEANSLTETINTGREPKKVMLEDGTTVTLQPTAKVAYPYHFSRDKREVYLEGEAFFHVTKNPARPFLVHSGNLVTQVLGTSFTIRPDKATNKMMIAVKTGKVAVFEDNRKVKLSAEQLKNNGAIITPNQKVVYDESNRSFSTSLVENPEPVLAENNLKTPLPSFSFNDSRLATVLENISKVYGIDISVENEMIYQCLFTGDISSQPLYEKLELVCQSTGHQYEIKGTKILIKGKGCL